MKRLLTTDQRVACRIGRTLHDEHGVPTGYADIISQQVLSELDRDKSLKELFIVRVTDVKGQHHACVMREAPAHARTLFRLNIAGHRKRARRELLEELRSDPSLNTSPGGTRLAAGRGAKRCSDTRRSFPE